jgi:hypothetical protein
LFTAGSIDVIKTPARAPRVRAAATAGTEYGRGAKRASDVEPILDAGKLLIRSAPQENWRLVAWATERHVDET